MFQELNRQHQTKWQQAGLEDRINRDLGRLPTVGCGESFSNRLGYLASHPQRLFAFYKAGWYTDEQKRVAYMDRWDRIAYFENRDHILKLGCLDVSSYLLNLVSSRLKYHYIVDEHGGDRFTIITYCYSKIELPVTTSIDVEIVPMIQSVPKWFFYYYTGSEREDTTGSGPYDSRREAIIGCNFDLNYRKLYIGECNIDDPQFDD